jgi:hypothetical protein
LPDPRSLRFGFGLGIFVFAVAWIALAWPASEDPAPRNESPASEERGAPLALEGLDPVEGLAERTEFAEDSPTESAFPHRGTQENARVQIVDGRTATPLAGIDVHATARWGGGNAVFTTDAEGSFEIADSLRVGAWKLTLVEPESEFDVLQPDLVWLIPATTTVVRRVRPHAQLQIEVRGPTGLPVAGATVNLARKAEGQARSYRRFWSDERGQLSLPWPPAGESTSGWRATAFHVDEGSCAPINLADSEHPALTVLQLETGARLELQVTDSVHAPIPFLQVRLRSLALTQQAFVAQVTGSVDHLDQDGAHVWTQLPPGEYTLSLRSPVNVGWLNRSVTLGDQTERIDWVVDTPVKPIALEGRLFEDKLELFPAVHQFVEIRDGVSDELIAGTRTDASGRFLLFGEATGEVVLYTGLLDSMVSFPPHVHRFPAGKRDVVLSGTTQSIDEVVLRVTDRATGAPIPNARLLRSDSDFDVLAGSSDSQGLLAARVIRRHSYVLTAEGYLPLEMTGSQTRSAFSIELYRTEND